MIRRMEMITRAEYFDLLDQIAGKTIAVIYIFEGEDAEGFKHYDIWRSNLISCWLNAIQELRCMPYILDVRTFLFKVANNTLPHIDYVINMNAGCEELSTLGLIPSVCGFKNLECIPCNTSTIISGENKNLSNMIAHYCNFKLPKELSSTDNGIFRPLNFGSSKGVQLTKDLNKTNSKGIVQEFITGYDVTTPLMYNPLTEEINTLPTVFYRPEVNDINWYLGNNAKETSLGFSREILSNVSVQLINKFISLAEKFDIDTYCRIDCRLYTDTALNVSNLDEIELNVDNCYFIEMNPMPTIETGNNFYVSIANVTEHSAFYHTIQYYNEYIEKHSIHGFILSCAIIKRIISTHKK